MPERFHEHLVGKVAHALGNAEHSRFDVVHIEASVALLGGAADDVVAEGNLLDAGLRQWDPR